MNIIKYWVNIAKTDPKIDPKSPFEKPNKALWKVKAVK